MAGRKAPPTVGILAVGAKGLGLVTALVGRNDLADIGFVATYEPRGGREPGVGAFRHVLAGTGIPVIDSRRPNLEALMSTHGAVDLILYVGWQYLSSGSTVPEVVLHDSLLPRLRGFNPTVTALIEGHGRIGVTAIVPTDDVDAGPILAQHAITVQHPIAIGDALAALGACYLAVASDVIAALMHGELAGTPQDHAAATYSIWRDELDYRLDLCGDSARVVRTVLALGDPYLGATLTLDGRTVRVLGAEMVADVPFEIRQPGKVWRLDPSGPVVVCGSGMVRLTRLVDTEGNDVRVERLRTRFS